MDLFRQPYLCQLVPIYANLCLIVGVPKGRTEGAVPGVTPTRRLSVHNMYTTLLKVLSEEEIKG